MITKKLMLGLILLLPILGVGAYAQSPEGKVTLDLSEARLEQAIDAIEQQTRYLFTITSEEVDLQQKVTLHVKNATLQATLEQLVRGTGLEYVISGKNITLSKKAPAEPRTVKGTVADAAGFPLPCAKDDNKIIWLGDKTAFYKETLAIFGNETVTLFDEKKLDPINVGGYSVAPWGIDNDLPQRVMQKIDKAEIVGTNANFNWKVAYGQGPRLVEVIRDPETNRAKNFKEVLSGPAYDWFTRNNVPLLLQEILTDLSYFGNAFPVLIAGDKQHIGGRNGIKGIAHREAMFSRWGLDKRKLINRHLYCANWDESPTRNDIQESYVVDEYNAVDDIRGRLTIGKDSRLCFPIYITSPGRPYYSYPNWWSIFRSGWYDQLCSIPALKKAILKHNLGVRHIIYIADEYFAEKEELLKIDKEDHAKRKELYEQVVKQLCEEVTGEENAGKAIVSKMKFMPHGNGSASFEQLMKVDTIKNDISGGEYLTDYETGANIISYAMDVHPSLIGATPGKNSNSLSGSNIREIFIMKQSLSKPMAYLALQWWPVVREINGWDRNLEIVIQDSLFTTLDNSKSGEIKVANNTNQ